MPESQDEPVFKKIKTPINQSYVNSEYMFDLNLSKEEYNKLLQTPKWQRQLRRAGKNNIKVSLVNVKV